MGKWAFITIMLAVFIIGGLVYAKVNESTPVPTAEVTKDDIDEFIDERAKTRLPRVHLITMPYTGRIEEIVLTEGAHVSKNQKVASVVPSDLQLAVDAASAAAERLDASIEENYDATVEETAKMQANEFVTSMTQTVKAALNRLQSGKAKLDFATSQLDRKKELRKQNAASIEDIEQAEVNLVQSRVDFQQDELVHSAMVAMQTATTLMPVMIQQYINRKRTLTQDVLKKQKSEAEAKLAQVEQDQRRGTMLSPIDGVVLARHIANERYISAGTVLLELGDLHELEIEADVLSQDVVNVKEGNEVRIYGPAIGSPEAHGAVARIYPAGFTKVSSLGVEQQRVKVIVKLREKDLQRLIAERGLGVDYRVRVQIFTKQARGVPVIPRSALSRSEDGNWQVYAVRDGRARKVSIKVGLQNDDFVEVKNGLQQGDVVVLAPEQSLTDGQRVTSSNGAE
jgi:HlyD family secretion protein